MRYYFTERKLGSGFAQEKITEIKTLIENSTPLTLSGMSGVGGSIFLRYLATQDFAYFVYIDTYQITDITRLAFYQLILKELGSVDIPTTEQQIIEKCRERLKELSEQNRRIVIIFNRFDQLKAYFNNQFFADIMSLRDVNLEKIVFIFTSNKPYLELLPDSISADKVNLFSRTIYLKPYNREDLEKLLLISGNAILHSDEFIAKAIELSGGHYQLLQLFLKSERLEPPFIDPFVKYQLKEIYNLLSFSHKKVIKKVALGKNVANVDPYLLGIGVVKVNGNKYQLFTPLFEEYVRTISSTKMSHKEAKLFKLLKENLGKVVSQDKIFEIVWAEEPDAATDWALSSLLYRLRKHPILLSQNLVIESYKKSGYQMIKG